MNPFLDTQIDFANLNESLRSGAAMSHNAESHADENEIDRADFIKDPGRAFRLAEDGERVVIVSPDGKRRAVLSVPSTELKFDTE